MRVGRNDISYRVSGLVVLLSFTGGRHSEHGTVSGQVVRSGSILILDYLGKSCVVEESRYQLIAQGDVLVE